MQRASFNNLQDLLSEANQGKTPHRVQSQDSERSTHGRRCVPVRPPVADFRRLPNGYAVPWVCDPRRLVAWGVGTEPRGSVLTPLRTRAFAPYPRCVFALADSSHELAAQRMGLRCAGSVKAQLDAPVDV